MCKMGDRLDAKNHRPISITPKITNNFASFDFEQLTDHLVYTQIFGFQKSPCFDTDISWAENAKTFIKFLLLNS